MGVEYYSTPGMLNRPVLSLYIYIVFDWLLMWFVVGLVIISSFDAGLVRVWLKYKLECVGVKQTWTVRCDVLFTLLVCFLALIAVLKV